MLTEKEIQEYAQEMAAEMSSDDRESFLTDPDGWKDGLTTNHVMAIRDDGDHYCGDGQWPAVRDAIIEAIGDIPVIVRISYETGGYVHTPDSADYIDASGPRYDTIKAAVVAALESYSSYTHYISRSGQRKIPAEWREAARVF